MSVPAKVIPIHKVEKSSEEILVSPMKESKLRVGWGPKKFALRVGVLCKRNKTSCASWHNDHNCYGQTCPFRDQ